MAKVSKKVASKSVESAEESKKARRPRFTYGSAVNESGDSIDLDEDGKLTEAPVNWGPEFAPLKRSDFSSKEVFFDWRIAVIRKRANDQIEELQAAKLEATEGPDPVKKNVRRFAKMAKQLAALKAALQESGVDLDDLEL